MTKMDIIDEITLTSDLLRDITHLSQTIFNGYFSISKDAVKDNEGLITYNYEQYAALFRIFDERLIDIAEKLQKVAKALLHNAYKDGTLTPAKKQGVK